LSSDETEDSIVQPVSIQPGEIALAPSDYVDLIVAREFRLGPGRVNRFRKGHHLTAEDVARLAVANYTGPIHTVRLEPGDVHEDDAARRIAAMIQGENLFARDPVQSRVNLIATRKGLLRVSAEAVFQLNMVTGISVFTLPDRLPVLPGKIVAGAKITPIAVPAITLDRGEEVLRGFCEPLVTLKPFLPQRVGVVVSEGLAGKIRDRFEKSLRDKMAWYGSEIIRFDYVEEDPDAVATGIRRFEAEGATLVLTAGGNMMDPFDASISALPKVGAEVIRYGAPAHPGSMFWLAWSIVKDLPIFNVASCSMYSRSTVADLVLPWVMAGERVTPEDLARIGYGGMLDRDMGWRFPQYDVSEVDEPDEEE
jgi:hypothetical protein